MGIFTTKTTEELEVEKQEQIRRTLEKYGLDLENYSTDEIKKRNVDNLKSIANDIKGNKWFKASMIFSFAKAEEQAKVTYLAALVEQNWILIRQNEIIIKELQSLNKK